MASSTPELKDILSTLEALRARVDVLSDGLPSERAQDDPCVQGGQQVQRPESQIQPGVTKNKADGLDPAHVSLLLDGILSLNRMHQPREFHEFFSHFVRQHGMRLLMLKRWTSGLQVYLEVGVKLPGEARRKRADGRAPIALNKGDVFTAAGEETAVYAGPVPARNFPLDLTLMLGRGSRERNIVILPLPSQGHWNTFLYMDGDDTMAQPMILAEILAHYALGRMHMLEKGVYLRQGRVEEILKTEHARRKGSGETQLEGPFGAAPSTSEPDTVIDPFTVLRQEKGPSANPVEHPQPEVPPTSVDNVEESDPTPENTEDPRGSGRPLTAKDILHHSGELPALPKAACHIMAVIEDPKTTATRLEKALAMDQALTAKVLRIANSPFYGAVREIRTVSESIVRLGFVAIRNWTLVTAARSVFLSPGAGALYRKIWTQSVLSAMAGQLVGQAMGMREPEKVFIGGLMQNIGQLVLARSYPELFQEILLESTSTGKPYHVIERGKLGFDHGELGAQLIREWNLSADLEDAVRWHHRFNDPNARNKKIAAMIALGEEIAWCGGADENEDRTSSSSREDVVPVPLSEAGQFLGFSSEKVAELGKQADALKIDPHFFN